MRTPGEKSLKRFDRAFLAHPEQASDADVDLIDQCQVFVALGVLDFIDADRVDLAQFPVFQTPGDDMFDRVENLVPGSAKEDERVARRSSDENMEGLTSSASWSVVPTQRRAIGATHCKSLKSVDPGRRPPTDRPTETAGVT
jgi:hypothetical protein